MPKAIVMCLVLLVMSSVKVMAANADLTSLSLSFGTLSPGLTPGTYSYTAAENSTRASITVTPVLAGSTLTVTVNGTVVGGTAPYTANLNSGTNTITIKVVKAGLTTVTYTLTVTRENISYTGSPFTYYNGVTITNLTPTVTGAPTGYTIAPALSAGLSMTPGGGVISGTPTATSIATTYTITATYAGGITATATINITVTTATISYTGSPFTYQDGITITNLTPTASGGPTSYTVVSLPAGLSITAATGVISGTPTAPTAAANYTITAHYTGGATATATINITISNPKITITFSTLSQVYGAVDVSKITFTTSGWVGTDNQATNLTTLPTAFCAATSSSPVGVYPITPNHDEVITSTTTYTVVYTSGSSLTITGAPLTLTATGPAETPGATPTPNPTTYTSNFTYYGAVNGETVTGVTLAISPTTLGASGTTYTVTPSLPTGANGFLASNYIITIKTYSGICGNNYTWTGNASTTWSTATNWNPPTGPPGTNDNVIIPNTAVSPTVTASTTVNTITFTGNEAITVNAAQTLTVNKSLSVPSLTTKATFTMALGTAHLTIGSATSAANVNNAGTLTVTGGLLTINSGTNYFYNSGTVILNGGNAFDITGNGSTGNIGLYNIGAFYVGTSNSACYLTFDDSQSILNGSTGNFFVGSTSYIKYFNSSAHDCHVTNNNNFTFQSDQYGSGSVLQIYSPGSGGPNTFDGAFTVERYVTGARAYRLLSSQVYAGTVSSNKVYDISYLKNYAFLSGTTGTAGGFDSDTKINPTLYLYRENNIPLYTTFLNSNFRGINSINTTPTYGMDDASYPSANIPIGSGVLFFYRGNRWSSLYDQTAQFTAGTPAEPTTLSTTGFLNQGAIKVHDWYTPGSANLGYTTVSGSANIEGFNLVGNPYPCSIDWDTYSKTISTNGVYAPNVGPFSYQLIPTGLQGAGNYGVYSSGAGGTGTNNSTHIIASGEGFFVQALNTGTPSLTFNEAAKISTQVTGSNLFMGVPPLAAVYNRRLRLQMAIDSINSDDMLIQFIDNAKVLFDPMEDALYRSGTGKVSISSLSADNMQLAINGQPFVTNGQTIPVNVNATASGTYSLSLTEIKGVPQLFDVWLVDKLQKDSVNLRTTKAYSFAINKTDTTTFGSRRFALSIRQDTAYAYRLLTFGANKVPDAKAVQVNWTAQHEENYTNFTVERSIDNGKTFNVLGGVSAAAAGSYSLVDAHPANGLNLYRLRSEDINNAISYSKVVPIGYSDQSGRFARSNLNVFPNPAKSDINLVVLNDLSKTESYNIMITNSMGFVMKKGTSGEPNWQASVADLLPGTYLVKVYNNKDQSLIGTTKFVKL